MKYFVINRHKDLVEISRESAIDLLDGISFDSLNLNSMENTENPLLEDDNAFIEIYIDNSGKLYIAKPELSFNSSVVHRSLEPVQEFFSRFDKSNIDGEQALETFELEALIAATVETRRTKTKNDTISLTLHSDPDTMAQLLEALLFKPGLYRVESLTSTKATTEFSTIDTVAMHITKNRISAIGY